MARSSLSFVLTAAVVTCGACSTIAPPKEHEDEGSAPVEDPVAEEPAESEPQDNTVTRHSDDEYEQLAAEFRLLQDRAIKTQLLLIERETQIEDLNQRLQAMQRRIDDAIKEVVRAKANMMSAESRAEAASQMATGEFEKQNYAGAMYLASQAKAVISLEQFRMQDRVQIEPSRGERTFDPPLPLQVIANSNLRDGPGLDYDVVLIIDKGTPLTGHSYKGKWVRVSLADGTRGWVYQNLIGGR
jgi:hypothetical protein